MEKATFSEKKIVKLCRKMQWEKEPQVKDGEERKKKEEREEEEEEEKLVCTTYRWGVSARMYVECAEWIHVPSYSSI